MPITTLRSIAGRAAREFFEDDALSQAAAIAFYSVLSLAPLVLLAVSAGGAIGQHAAVADEIVRQMGALIGSNGAQLARTLLHGETAPDRGWLAILGTGLLIFAATTVFAQVQHALNRVWGVRVRQGRWLWPLIRARLMSLAMILVVGALLLGSVLLTSLVAFAQSRLEWNLPGGDLLWQAGSFLGSFVLFAALFAMIFRALPDARIAWQDVTMGAVLTAVLFSTAKEILGYVLGRVPSASAYGAAGSLVVLLLWVYFVSILFLGGAELTLAYARARNREIVPKPWAEIIPSRAPHPGA